MKQFYLVVVFFSIVIASACSKVGESDDVVVPAAEELSIGLPIQISRTAIDEEGRASWVTGDKFALWAKNKNGQKIINAADFVMMYYWHSRQSAVFTSYQRAIEEDLYTYYAVSPTPLSVDNNLYTATYHLPAVQQGNAFNSAYDIMVAEPVLNAPALSSDVVNALALDFKHKMHIVKVNIKKNNFSLDISRLVITFPTAVVGDITIDVSNAAAAPQLSNGSNTLTINLDEPINESGTAWGIIYPATLAGNVKVTAYAADGTQSLEKTFPLEKVCKEGHITPLDFTTSNINPPTLKFAIGKNYLGEAIQKWSILDESGATIHQWSANNTNSYIKSFNGSLTDSGFTALAGKTLTARFESKSAVVTRTFQMPSTISPTVTIVPEIDVPFLFFEDFSGAKSYEKNDERVSNLMEAPGYLLNGYMPDAGWNAAHFRLEAGKSIRINVRHQSTLGVTRSNGRLDTPTMSNLKSGANVKLKVTFDMGAYVDSGYNSNNDVFCMAGIHTNSGTLNGIVNTQGFGNVGNDASRVKGAFSSVCLQTGYLPASFGSNSFDSVFPTYEFTATGCSNATRLLWIPCCVQTVWGTANNAHYYLYIDNIRVQIVE